MDPVLKAAAAVVVAAVVAVSVASIGPRAAPAGPTYTIPAYSKALDAEIAAYAAAVGPAAPKAAAEGGGIRLRSVGFELPTSDQAFPPGAGAELIANNCQSCHSPGMILTQPPLTRAEWTGEVTKMMRIYKAPVSDENVAEIVTYLVGLNVGP